MKRFWIKTSVCVIPVHNFCLVHWTDIISRALRLVAWVPVKCHVTAVLFKILCNWKNVLYKEKFCTILVGYLIILFKEVLKTTNCPMHAYSYI